MMAGLACPYSWDLPRHCPGSPAAPRREPELADLCSTRR